MRTGNTGFSFAKRVSTNPTYEIHACSLILPVPLLSRKQNGTNRSLSSCFFRTDVPSSQHRFKQLKATAIEAEASFIRDVTFHDLRHDFAHRAKKEARLDDGELAVYLGHITKRGTPAIQTTARYTQPSMNLWHRIDRMLQVHFDRKHRKL